MARTRNIFGYEETFFLATNCWRKTKDNVHYRDTGEIIDYKGVSCVVIVDSKGHRFAECPGKYNWMSGGKYARID